MPALLLSIALMFTLTVIMKRRAGSLDFTGLYGGPA